jgi:hypothetical protein
MTTRMPPVTHRARRAPVPGALSRWGPDGHRLLALDATVTRPEGWQLDQSRTASSPGHLPRPVHRTLGPGRKGNRGSATATARKTWGTLPSPDSRSPMPDPAETGRRRSGWSRLSSDGADSAKPRIRPWTPGLLPLGTAPQQHARILTRTGPTAHSGSGWAPAAVTPGPGHGATRPIAHFRVNSARQGSASMAS